MTAAVSTLEGIQNQYGVTSPLVFTSGGSMKGFFNKSSDWWMGFGTGLFCAFVGLISGKLWRGEATVLKLITGMSWGLIIAVGFCVGLYLINKPRLDREAEERRKISKKYERWVRGDYTVEELQNMKTEE